MSGFNCSSADRALHSFPTRRSSDLAPATATAGNNLTYSLKVTNNGPSDNAGYTLKDVSADEHTSDPHSPYGVECPRIVASTSSGLGNGANKSFTITAHIGSGYADGGDLANTGSIDSSATADSVPANNSSTSHTTVSRDADLQVEKTAPATATAGDSAGFHYVITVH